MFYSFYLSEFGFVVWVFEIGSDYVALDGLELAIYSRLVLNSDLPASASQRAGSEVSTTSFGTFIRFLDRDL